MKRVAKIELKEAKDPLANAEVNVLKWEQIPLLDRESTEGMPLDTILFNMPSWPTVWSPVLRLR
jgi:hypothetical protein